MIKISDDVNLHKMVLEARTEVCYSAKQSILLCVYYAQILFYSGILPCYCYYSHASLAIMLIS